MKNTHCQPLRLTKALDRQYEAGEVSMPQRSEGIDYFFSNFFRQGDQVIILVEGQILNIERGKGISGLTSSLKDTLQKYKHISTASTYKAYQDLRYEADRVLAALRHAELGRYDAWARDILKFYENYQRLWRAYKSQFITPELQIYQSVIKKVKPMEGEKWALCFQQREMFPKLRNEGPLDREIREKVEIPSDDPVLRAMQMNIKSKQMELMSLFDLTGDIPSEALKNLFMEANITFHLILMKSLRPLVEKDFELREVAQDYENCFKDISFSTGGHTVFSNKVSEALQEAAETEDYHYLLVYSPKDNQPEKNGISRLRLDKKAWTSFT